MLKMQDVQTCFGRVDEVEADAAALERKIEHQHVRKFGQLIWSHALVLFLAV